MTLFPDMVRGVLSESIIGRAQTAGVIEVACHDIRDYTTDKHRKTDDTPFGGGMGMLMTCQPIFDCYEHVSSRIAEGAKKRVIYMSPKGRTFTHEVAKELAEYDELVDYALKHGLKNGFTQEWGTASESFIPPFDNTGVEK